MSLRQLQFRILCLACTLFGCALTLTGQTPDIIGLEKPFPPLEKWRSAIVAGDASSLRLLYSTNPVAHIQTASGTVDSDAAVHYWINEKVRDMKIEVGQTSRPSPTSNSSPFRPRFARQPNPQKRRSTSPRCNSGSSSGQRRGWQWGT